MTSIQLFSVGVWFKQLWKNKDFEVAVKHKTLLVICYKFVLTSAGGGRGRKSKASSLSKGKLLRSR